MGLLDDLKKQAELVKTQQNSLQSLREGNLKLVEEKMRQAFQYLNELLKQLAVLKPVNAAIYSLPGIADLKNLGFSETFIDYRHKRINDREYFDSINFFIRWGSGETFVVERDMPAAALNEALLEEFAKTLLGQPGAFRKYRTAPGAR